MSYQHYLTEGMGRYHRRRAIWAAATEPVPAPSATDYQAPTVVLEDQVFTIGSTKDAAKFELVKEELGKHVATQPWSDGADAAMAFETLTETIYNEPAEPVIPERFYSYKDKSVEEPEYENNSLRYHMQLSMYTRNHDEWSKTVKNWKNNRSGMFAIVLQHCPKDLTQRLKLNPGYSVKNSTKDIIALTRMINDSAHSQDNTTQGTMAIVESNVYLHTAYMSKTEKPVDFFCTFQATVDTINTHGGCAGHHPQLVSEYGQGLCKERGMDPYTCDTTELK